MIKITEKSQCCGCSACVQACPKQCISFSEDKEGFPYPLIEENKCINCGICQIVCPAINRHFSLQDIEISAGKCVEDAIRESSSSGGVFTKLAEKVISQGGIVFGAKWNDKWEVNHSSTDSQEGIRVFQGSKYSQSIIGQSFKEAEAFLSEGKEVLFSGTPCQIAGLKNYLQKDYNNLITVECACHGVPSPGLWRKYLTDIKKGREIVSINQRNKCTGWRNYSVVIEYSNGDKDSMAHDFNPWTRAFIKNLTLRPSCYNCAFKSINSMADITLGDFWGVDRLYPQFNDDRGVSLIITHSEKGKDLLKEIPQVNGFSMQDIAQINDALFISATQNPLRSRFFELVEKKPFGKVVSIMTKDPLIRRIKRFVRRVI